MYGPDCWQEYGTDSGGFKKMMWYHIMKEDHCKAISTWLSCDERKEMAFTHKQWGKNGRTSRLDSLLGSTQVLHVFTIKLSSTWDHFPVYAVILKGEEGRCYVKKEKAWVKWQPRDGGARIVCKKKVVYPEEGIGKYCLETIQKKTEHAAKEIAHTTKLERDRERGLSREV